MSSGNRTSSAPSATAAFRPANAKRRARTLNGSARAARREGASGGRRILRWRRWRAAAQIAPEGAWNSYGWAIAATVICTVATLPLAMRVDLINVVMVYMVGSALTALRLGRGPSTLTAIANILAFDYFFVPPRFSLYVADISYLITFAAMLAVTLIIAHLVIAVREQALLARARERRTAALYAITRELAEALDVPSMARATVRRVADELHCDALILLCDEQQRLANEPIAASRDGLCPDFHAATWAVAEGKRLGVHTQRREGDPALYLPLEGPRRSLGLLIVQPTSASRFAPEQERLLEAFAALLASALERARLTEIANAAHLAAESAAIRNTLLASISHDLRTPLSAISGAGSIVAQCEFKLDVYRRATLGKLIEDKARDMSALLSNVLDLVRLESQPTALARDWHNLEDLVGLAIQRNESRLAGWEVVTEIAEDLPMVALDSTLFVQMLSNLLENTTKFTPPGTRVLISAAREEREERDDGLLRLAVEDNGPGWGEVEPERLFEKFSRGAAESAAPGVGLGLCICRAIARLHGGEIRAAVNRGGGARFEIDLPVAMEDARLDAAACEA